MSPFPGTHVCGILHVWMDGTLQPTLYGRLLRTSYHHDNHHYLEDAVDEWEGEHDLEILWGERELHDGAAQLGVLEARFQSYGATPRETDSRSSSVGVKK